MINIDSLVLNVITSLLATLSTTFSSFSSIFFDNLFLSFCRYAVLYCGDKKKESLNFNNNNNSNNNIYPGSPLALAVFSGALQIINDKITTTINHLLQKLKLRKEIKIDIYI